MSISVIQTGTAIIVGGDGSRFYAGDPAPSNTLGVNNDVYFQTTGDVYEKENGVWKLMFNIIGPAGSPLVNRGQWVMGMTVNPSDFVYDRSTNNSTVQAMFVSKSITTFTSNAQPYADVANWQEFSGVKGEQGDKGETGNSGTSAWTMELAIVVSGERRVMQVVDWFGGSGQKPATGLYVGATGFVSSPEAATDIRGPQGAGSGTGTGGVQSVTGDFVNNTDPDNPVISGILAALASKQDTLAYTPENAAKKGQANGYAALDANSQISPATIAVNASNRFVTDTEKNTWNNKQAALGFTPENVASKGQVNGYAGLDSSGKIDPALLPALSLNSITLVANQAARLALNAKVGDAVKQSDNLSTYMLSVLPASTDANWIEIGDMSPDWSTIGNKPTTFPPVIGAGATQAVAGNDARLTNARTPTAHTHPSTDITDFATAVNTLIAAKLPTPPGSGTFELKAVNGVVQWVPVPTYTVVASLPSDLSGYADGSEIVVTG